MFKTLMVILALVASTAHAVETKDEVQACRIVAHKASQHLAKAGGSIHQLEMRGVLTYEEAQAAEYKNTIETVDYFWRLDRYSKLGAPGTAADCQQEGQNVINKVDENMTTLKRKIDAAGTRK